jgi:hypothetical protein
MRTEASLHYWLKHDIRQCTMTFNSYKNTLKPAHVVTSIKAVTCIKRSSFSGPAIEHFI